jgi:hypothetical protein
VVRERDLKRGIDGFRAEFVKKMCLRAPGACFAIFVAASNAIGWLI